MNTDQTTEGATLRILAVDISNIFRRSWEAAQGKEFSEGYSRTLQTVAKYREGHDRVAICCDGGRSFRKSISPQYKADRTDPGEAYREQLRRTIERLRADGATVFESPQVDGGFAEADDVIGSLCRWALEMGHSVSILSSDKDVLACVTSKEATPRICRIKPDSGEAQYAEDLQATVGIVPAQVPEWLALAGDDSDGFKPYKGLGPKSAMKLLTKYGSLPVVFKASAEELAAVLENKPLAERISAAGPDPAMTALRLATLNCDLFMDFDPLLNEPVPQALVEPQAQAFAASDKPQPAQEAAEPATTKDATKTQALVIAKQPNRIDRTALQPRTLRQLGELARVVANSRLFPRIRTQEHAFLVMHMANEHGVPAMTALMHAYIVHDQLSWSAQYLAGLCLRARELCEVLEIVETTEAQCVVRYKRVGRPVGLYKVTIEEAHTRGWVKRGSKWEQDPRTMLRWCGYRECCRFVWPEIVGGLYTPDELRDGQATDAEYADAEAA